MTTNNISLANEYAMMQEIRDETRMLLNKVAAFQCLYGAEKMPDLYAGLYDGMAEIEFETEEFNNLYGFDA